MSEAYPADEIERDFWIFHHENPHVYRKLVHLALQLKRRGWKHYGIGALFEVVRFHHALETTDPNFKLNHNYRALYSRLIMKEHEFLLGDFFEIRVRKCEKSESEPDDYC